MNRILVSFAVLFSTSGLLLVDSAVKGALLLFGVAVVVMLMRRDSAATRHLVWLVAMIAILIVPVLSATLPQWRVMPAWFGVASEPVHVIPNTTTITNEDAIVELPGNRVSVPAAATELPSQPVSVPTNAAPSLAGEITVNSMNSNWSWIGKGLNVLPPVWAIGSCFLILRLIAARLILLNNERRATVLWQSKTPTRESRDPVVLAFEDACSQLGLNRSVTLLVHSEKTIPMVWGILFHRLLLPAGARNWSREQLRSVLLHELAHIKRRDTLTQLLTQVACTLHWINPLIWFATWRMHVERERACDDLVLSSGVRPSAYAEHLLEVATRHSPPGWTHACGLAMARKSSLEGRLVAVLSQKLNRRRVSMAFALFVLVLGVSIVIPIAMLGAAEAQAKPQAKPEPAQKPKATEEAESSLHKVPSDRTAARLLERWMVLEGTKTKLSEQTVARLRMAIDKWVKQHSTRARSVHISRLRDWHIGRAEHPVIEIVAWLDEIAAIDTGLLQFAINSETRVGWTLSPERQASLRFGPVQNGLRAAWGRYPHRDAYVLGDVVYSRLVIQNSSDNTIQFKLPYSLDGILNWKVTTAGGRKIETDNTLFTGGIPLYTWRLLPGEVVEIGGRSVAIGEGEPRELNRVPISTLLRVQRGEQISVRGTVSKPFEMVTGDVSFKVVKIEDVPVWSTSQAGTWKLPNGVTMEVKQELVHASDIASTAHLSWTPDRSGRSARHEVWLGGDAFAAREPWLLAWERGKSVLWTMRGDMQSSYDFHRVLPTPRSLRRIDFSDPNQIKETTWAYLHKSTPASIRSELTKGFRPLSETPPTPAHSRGHQHIVRAESKMIEIGPEPKLEIAKLIFRRWQAKARTDGKIPGALIGDVAQEVGNFIRLNPRNEHVPELREFLKRCDTSHDWSQADAVTLLDELGVIRSRLLGWVESQMHFSLVTPIKAGRPLPVELKNAPWGQPKQNGIRAAWLLVPRSDEYPSGSLVKTRVLFHNSGSQTIVFRTQTWHQYGQHSATDSKGERIQVPCTQWTYRSPHVTCRLAPNEYVELESHGFAIGTGKYQRHSEAGRSESLSKRMLVRRFSSNRRM